MNDRPFSREQIAASKARLNIPDDWTWYPCAADCGDLVWCPPEFVTMAALPVCSNDCAALLMMKTSSGDPMPDPTPQMVLDLKGADDE